MATRNDLHLLRRLWHLFYGLLVTFGCLYLERTTALALMALVLAGHALGEAFRHNFPAINTRFLAMFGGFTRESERNRIQTGLYFAASTLLVAYAAPKPIAVLSLGYLALGDPLAAMVGTRFGKNRMSWANGKSVEGAIACYAVCAIFTLIYFTVLPHPGTGSASVLALALAGGAIATAAELAPIPRIDDNLVIPIASALMLWPLLSLTIGL